MGPGELNAHTGLRQGKRPGPIASYCTGRVLFPVPVPCSVNKPLQGNKGQLTPAQAKILCGLTYSNQCSPFKRNRFRSNGFSHCITCIYFRIRFLSVWGDLKVKLTLLCGYFSVTYIVTLNWRFYCIPVELHIPLSRTQSLSVPAGW